MPNFGLQGLLNKWVNVNQSNIVLKEEDDFSVRLRAPRASASSLKPKAYPRKPQRRSSKTKKAAGVTAEDDAATVCTASTYGTARSAFPPVGSVAFAPPRGLQHPAPGVPPSSRPVPEAASLEENMCDPRVIPKPRPVQQFDSLTSQSYCKSMAPTHPATASKAAEIPKHEDSCLFVRVLNGMDGLHSSKVRRSQHRRSARENTGSKSSNGGPFVSLGLESLADETVEFEGNLKEEEEEADRNPKKTAARRRRRPHHNGSLGEEKMPANTSAEPRPRNFKISSNAATSGYESSSTSITCAEGSSDDDFTVHGPNGSGIHDDRFVGFDGWVILASLVESNE